MKWITSTYVALISSVVIVAGTAERLQFDAASIKQSTSVEAGGTYRPTPGGGFTAQNFPAMGFITIAYQLQPFQLVSVPEWARTTRYNVSAKPAGPSTGEENLLMLQALLQDRFNLAFHREHREVEGYSLLRARLDKLGANIRSSTIDCTVIASPFPPRCREGFIRVGSMKAVGVPISRLTVVLVGQMNGPINDETRLTGTYDFELQWSNDVGGDGDLRPIDIAIQDQLGLKLERRRVTSEMFVVDRLDRPMSD